MAKIKNKTVVIIMLTLVVLIFLSALTLLGTDLAGFEVPLKVTGIILLSAVLINIVEIGAKRLTPISDLKKLSAQQYASLIIGALVLITAIFFLFGAVPPFISTFAPGLLFLEGIIIFLEIFI